MCACCLLLSCRRHEPVRSGHTRPGLVFVRGFLRLLVDWTVFLHGKNQKRNRRDVLCQTKTFSPQRAQSSQKRPSVLDSFYRHTRAYTAATATILAPMEQDLNPCRKPVLWPDDDSWIDLTAVRESILNCVAADTGVVDTDALELIEFEHNRRLAADALKIVPVGSHIGIVKTYCSIPAQRTHIDGGTLYIARHENGRFSLARGGTNTWSAQEMADAIAAVSLVIHIDTCGRGDYGRHSRVLQRISERSWMRAATAALADGPGQVSWTAESIDAMGAVLRTLTSLCDDRACNYRAAPKERFCSPRALALATTISKSSGSAGVGATYGGDWVRVMDTGKSLRGMLAWIDAMERTDAIFEHMLKHYQAARIDRALAADSRIAPSPDEPAQAQT
nr:hypothetical protein [Pandoravirus massiliensis]